MFLAQQVIKDLHGGFRRAVHLNNCVAFVRRHLQLILQAVDALDQVMLQLVVGLLQKTLYQLPGTGHGGVDHHGEILHPVHLPGLLRLNQWHVPVQGQPIGIKGVVEGVHIHLNLLL